MAPTPVDNSPNSPEPSSAPQENKWGTATIVALAIFVFFVLAFGITLTGFYLHRRAQRKKLPPSHRPTSYRPFRTNAKSGLLANAAPTPETEDKSSMFSRDRSSITLYAEHDHHDKRASAETVSLIPLHVTPAEEVHDPMDRTTSVGSRPSVSTGGSLGLSIPVPGESEELGVRTTRPRSTSSTRYYTTNTTDPAPQIPKIVHTPSL